jgi:hypothetical protein
VDGPFWTDLPTWNIEACCGINEVDVQAHKNFGIECTMLEQASLSTPWIKQEKGQKKCSLTNSMEQTPFWASDRSSASQ